MLKSTPMTSKNRSSSSIFELNQDTPEIHPWYKLSRLQAKILQICMLKSTPWPLNRSRSSIFELDQDTPRVHPWYKFGPNAINICWVILFTSENWKFVFWNRPPWPRQIGQSHPSSNLTKTLLGYIHGISLGPMRLIFVELSCLHRKCWQTDGHANLIVWLVTRKPAQKHENKNHICMRLFIKYTSSSSTINILRCDAKIKAMSRWLQ